MSRSEWLREIMVEAIMFEDEFCWFRELVGTFKIIPFSTRLQREGVFCVCLNMGSEFWIYFLGNIRFDILGCPTINLLSFSEFGVFK